MFIIYLLGFYGAAHAAEPETAEVFEVFDAHVNQSVMQSVASLLAHDQAEAACGSAEVVVLGETMYTVDLNESIGISFAVHFTCED